VQPSRRRRDPSTTAFSRNGHAKLSSAQQRFPLYQVQAVSFQVAEEKQAHSWKDDRLRFKLHACNVQLGMGFLRIIDRKCNVANSCVADLASAARSQL
jgi:hypothetical protein